MIKVIKTTGIPPTQLRSDDLDKRLYNHYVDYFRGKHHATFSKNEPVRHLLELDSVAVRNELDPQPVNLPIDQIRVF